MTLASRHNIELLAPVGSVEAFFGAMEAGADAVYCGLKDFSARAKAKNFTIAEMENLCAYAHKLNRKLYIPLNTLIKETELPQLVEVLEGIARCRIDGLIIQDLGVYNLVHRFFPEIPLHASTQMAVHNIAGVKTLERMGFERVVLARELSLAEIKAIRQDTSIELEHFIHGALCYSISGQCLFSSYQTGNSGNRGRCAQPCRRRYNQNNSSQFTFSTSDLSSLALLPQLAASGIMSFKIEGRMKNAEYVWNVVRAYRHVLDAPETDLTQAIKQGETTLTNVHGRQTTSGFLTANPKDILLPDQKGGIGKPAGQIERTGGKQISFTCQTDLHIGDKLRVQPQTDKPGLAFTIRGIMAGKKKLKQARPGQLITVQTPFFEHFTSGDHIFKISTGRGFTLSEEACTRRLTTATRTPVAIDLKFSCSHDRLSVTATKPIHFSQHYEVETYAANKSPLNLTTLVNIFKKTAHPQLHLANAQTSSLPQVVIKPSRLKEIRRDFYGKLCLKIDLFTENNSTQRQARISTKFKRKLPAPTLKKRQLFVQATAAHKDLIHATDITLILPVATQLTDLEPCILDLPTIIYEKQWQAVAEQVQQKIALGYTTFRLNNISHFNLFTPSDALQLIAGPFLYGLNHQALQALTNLDIHQTSISLEDDRTNIISLAQHATNIMVTVYGHIPLMTSRIPLSSTEPIKTKAGEELSPYQDNELFEIQGSSPFSLSGRLQELSDHGLHNFLIDLRGCSLRQRQEILQAIRHDRPIQGCTSFNFDRGLA